MKWSNILNCFTDVKIFKRVTLSILFSSLAINPICYATDTESEQYAVSRLDKIHSQLQLKYGNLNEEYPEQLITALYLPADAKVLELGSDVGRNTCVIAKILNDSRNLVTMEPRHEAIFFLTANRNHNHLKFHIENAAISKIPLIQKGWLTIPSEKVLPGYDPVATVTFNEIQNKYAIEFDTLVVDCEGALYYILRDDPGILNKIKLVIIENDFSCLEHYNFVANMFIENGLVLVHNRHTPYWGENGFYQVWKKEE